MKPSGIHSVTVVSLELKVRRCRKGETTAGASCFLAWPHRGLGCPGCFYACTQVRVLPGLVSNGSYITMPNRYKRQLLVPSSYLAISSPNFHYQGKTQRQKRLVVKRSREAGSEAGFESCLCLFVNAKSQVLPLKTPANSAYLTVLW